MVMPKKILVVDDSALMRRVICDIIESDKKFQVADQAADGYEALELLMKNQYDAVVLDVNMPKMTGLQLLEELRRNKISVRVMMASTDTGEGAKTTLDALEFGALDFIQKPGVASQYRGEAFRKEFMRVLEGVSNGRPSFGPEEKAATRTAEAVSKSVDGHRAIGTNGAKVVAIASSTGGPKALQSVIPKLPAGLDAPVLLVQHMPKGFTASLAGRLDAMSAIAVKEAQEGEELQKGTVYVAMGGAHMNVVNSGGKHIFHYSDEPHREGVKPSANYMYESLLGSRFDKVVCVVLTGMGSDGTEGIRNLKAGKKVHVISQDQESCTVYGMPKAVVTAGLSDQTVPLERIAQEIALNIGVRG